MSNRRYKMVHAPMVSALVEVAEHMAKLEVEIEDMKWRAIWREDPDFDVIVPMERARKHCRNLGRALQRIDMSLRSELDQARAQNVVSIEEQRKNADN